MADHEKKCLHVDNRCNAIKSIPEVWPYCIEFAYYQVVEIKTLAGRQAAAFHGFRFINSKRVDVGRSSSHKESSAASSVAPFWGFAMLLILDTRTQSAIPRISGECAMPAV
jgi:hypothetical protein